MNFVTFQWAVKWFYSTVSRLTDTAFHADSASGDRSNIARCWRAWVLYYLDLGLETVVGVVGCGQCHTPHSTLLHCWELYHEYHPKHGFCRSRWNFFVSTSFTAYKHLKKKDTVLHCQVWKYFACSRDYGYIREPYPSFVSCPSISSNFIKVDRIQMLFLKNYTLCRSGPLHAPDCYWLLAAENKGV